MPKMITIFRTIFWMLFVSETVASIFNPEELVNVHYDVDIIGEPKLTTESIQSATSMTLLSKHGQRYECILPTNMYTMGHSGAFSDENLKEKTLEEEDESKKVKSNDVSIPKLLDGMEEGPCLRLSKGWWEYELCFRRQIRQYHRNEQNGAIENEIILGEFTSEFDWKTDDVTTQKSTSQRKGPRSHTQEYTKGSICDLTGNQRRAEVVYQCDLTPQAMDALVDVEEPASCVYRLTVKTPRLCENPLLRRAAEEQMPSRRRPPETIQCRPLLEPESMMKYKEVQAKKETAKQRAAEAKRLKDIFAANQRQRMSRILEIMTSKFRGPLRRRKFAQLTSQRFWRLRKRLRMTERSMFMSDKVLDSATRLSSEAEKSLKQMTKELKAKFRASKMKQKRPGRKKTVKEDENFEALRKAISTLPEAVRQKLTSTEGLNTLKSGLGSQVQQILEAAKSEVGGDGVDSEVSHQEMMQKISEMIDQLLVQVNNAGKRLDEEAKMLNARTKELQQEILARTGQGAVDAKKTSATPVMGEKGSKESEEGKKGEQPKAAPLKRSSSEAVQNKMTRESGDKSDEPEVITLADKAAEAEKMSARGDAQGVGKKPSAMAEDVEAMRGRLESELRQKMSKTGIDSNVLLHVMTVADKDGNGGSGKKDKPAFVGIIILKNDQQQREEERMKRLDKNYNFRIDDPPS